MAERLVNGNVIVYLQEFLFSVLFWLTRKSLTGLFISENVLEQLRQGIAKFELVSSPVASISNPNPQTLPVSFYRDNTNLFFARIAPPSL